MSCFCEEPDGESFRMVLMKVLGDGVIFSPPIKGSPVFLVVRMMRNEALKHFFSLHLENSTLSYHGCRLDGSSPRGIYLVWSRGHVKYSLISSGPVT